MTNWTDNPATTSTHIRTIHINELRGAVNTDRAAVRLAAYPWTDDPVTTSTHIRAVHFLELRTAIQELWFIKRLGPLPNLSVGTPPMSSRQVSARDINDLRGWLDTYDRSPAPGDPQGIVSFAYDPTAGPGHTPAAVSDEFCIDVANLTLPSQPKFLIRTRIIADPGNSVSYSGYEGAMGVWGGHGFASVGGILTSDFDLTSVGCPNDVLGYRGIPPERLHHSFRRQGARLRGRAGPLRPRHLLGLERAEYSRYHQPGRQLPAAVVGTVTAGVWRHALQNRQGPQGERRHDHLHREPVDAPGHRPDRADGLPIPRRNVSVPPE